MSASDDALPVVTLVTGDDPTLVADRVHTLVAELAGGEDSALVVEDLGSEGTVDAAVEACQTPPFLTDRRVVVVRDAGRFTAEEVAPLVDYLSDPLPTTALALVGGGGTVPAKLVAAVKKAGTVIDTKVGTGRARAAWFEERMRKAPVKLDGAARNLVADHLGEDVGRLTALLETLTAAFGEGSPVGASQVADFLGEAGGVAPWDLTDAIDKGDTSAALSCLHRMLEGGDRHPLVVMATLHRHYQSILRLDGSGVTGEKDAAELLGVAPYPAKKALTQSRRLGSAGLLRAIELLADADADLRGRRPWPEDLVLEVLVARLSRLSRTAAS